jgi:hypothetical protein
MIRERGRKYGPILNETTLSITQDLFISGPNSCGKTRWLQKLSDRAGQVWAGKEKLFLRALEPLQRWYEDDRVQKHAEKLGHEWKKLKGFQKIDLLLEWMTQNKVVLLLDDAHKLAGRKLDLIVRMCRAAHLLVVGAFAEQAVPMSLRMTIDARAPQKIMLKSEAAYDATNITLWLIILIAVGAGFWQLAAALGGMKVLAGGKRAAKQT